MLLTLVPVVLVTWLSLFANEVPTVPPSGYTLKWYAASLANQQFLTGFSISIQVAVIATAIGLVLTIPAAIALAKRAIPYSDWMVQFLMGPMIVPAIVLGAGLYVTFIQLEIAFDLPFVGSVPGLVLGHILITIPWSLRLLLANLNGVNQSIEDAAESLGARPFTVLTKVTLPLVWPGLVAGALFSFVVSFSNLEISLFLVAPGQTTLPIAILQYLQWKLDPSVAAASVLQIAVITIGVLMTDRFVPLTKVV
ncbi:ABC transporter permease [Bosea sp. AK1]|uniref:ABC transporter permease n=1 Tax=Bosea sp. AK1 TaxID=2587160 RepID=UPI00115090A6|nr:ABC transporter permease [Bosea sp. AK1]